MNRNELVSAVFKLVPNNEDVSVNGEKQAINASNWWALRVHESCNKHAPDSSANINLGTIMSDVLKDVQSNVCEAGGEARLSQQEADALNAKQREVIRALTNIASQQVEALC
ncbi:hypothetical protein HOF56_00930 [Candidatus Peribacteria bacterium]|jgi:hypothetical protein|nr:hypothetical protein [Candidatus Peribacteria bacterium]MBT4020837.1 hypothetical protein [Candidatus Peribacteria bacterium]MBT4241126.1 hypothetical protein [Candidatus Peribacteria bacterium]MBT4473848.1 hypothetical protein [Candidatus Peribacteria bacterium]